MTTKERDAAMLLWVDDLLNDERFLLMSPAAKGIYVVLLCHGWREGSVPACSEHLARIARVSVDEFAKLWPEIATCYSPHPSQPGRLVQSRQERERAMAEERRRKRADKARKAADARWKDHPKKPRAPARGTPPSTASGSAPRDATSIPQASPVAMRGDAQQSKAKLSPQPPETQTGPIEIDPQKPEAAPETSDPEVAVVRLHAALKASQYRNGTPALKRTGELVKQARRLHANGLTLDDLASLITLDEEQADEPGALLATWLDDDTWREELDEKRNRAKEARVQARAERGGDPYAAADPKLAGSVLSSVLADVRDG